MASRDNSPSPPVPPHRHEGVYWKSDQSWESSPVGLLTEVWRIKNPVAAAMSLQEANDSMQIYWHDLLTEEQQAVMRKATRDLRKVGCPAAVAAALRAVFPILRLPSPPSAAKLQDAVNTKKEEIAALKARTRTAQATAALKQQTQAAVIPRAAASARPIIISVPAAAEVPPIATTSATAVAEPIIPRPMAEYLSAAAGPEEDFSESTSASAPQPQTRSVPIADVQQSVALKAARAKQVIARAEKSKAAFETAFRAVQRRDAILNRLAEEEGEAAAAPSSPPASQLTAEEIFTPAQVAYISAYQKAFLDRPNELPPAGSGVDTDNQEGTGEAAPPPAVRPKASTSPAGGASAAVPIEPSPLEPSAEPAAAFAVKLGTEVPPSALVPVCRPPTGHLEILKVYQPSPVYTVRLPDGHITLLKPVTLQDVQAGEAPLPVCPSTPPADLD